MAGVLLGIARHARPRGPMDVVERVRVTREGGIQGDFRGSMGKTGKRQVSLMAQDAWSAATGELGVEIAWQERRANLLVGGVDLPRQAGHIIAIGPDVRIETTVECDPCSRMEEIAPGLKAVLTPDWRGGVLGRVIAEGEIAVGDAIVIEG